MLDAAEHKKLVRVVDVVLIRISCTTGNKIRFLIEQSEVFADGRKRDGLDRLPGTKKEPHENTKRTAARILQDILGIDSKLVKFSREREVFEEGEESRSFPGLQTVYRKEIIEGVVILSAAAQLEAIGLGSGNSSLS